MDKLTGAETKHDPGMGFAWLCVTIAAAAALTGLIAMVPSARSGMDGAPSSGTLSHGVPAEAAPPAPLDIAADAKGAHADRPEATAVAVYRR